MVKNILWVFYNRGFWTTIPSLTWKTSIISFSLVSIIHSFLFAVFLMFFILPDYKAEIDAQFSDPFPSFQIQNGELVPEVATPYVRQFKDVVFVMDPQDEQGESLTGDVVGGILLSKNKAFIKQGSNVDVLPFGQVSQFSFGKAQYNILWFWLQRVGVPLYTLVVWVLELFRTLLFSLFLSFVVLLFARIRKYPLHMNLNTLVKIGFWSAIPSYLFDALILDILFKSFSSSIFGFLPVIIHIVYMFKIVKQCSESEGINTLGGESPSDESEEE